MTAHSKTMRTNFVTNIGSHDFSGGYSGMNKAAWDMLSSVSTARYIGPISPAPSLYEHVHYKLRSLLKVRRHFFYFSDARLKRIAKEVNSALEAAPCDLVFFHGFTPWLYVKPPAPYIAWNDCTFLQYLSIYHDGALFSGSDIARIANAEADWLRKADAIWFRNAWTAESATSEYRLNKDKVQVIGNYGLMALPCRDVYERSRDFLFISTDFVKKGGNYAVGATARIVQEFPDARLIVIGAAPPAGVMTKPFVRYVGFLRKTIPSEYNQLIYWMSKVRAIVHPTTADTNPMVLIEAGYHGCPAIASRRFSIPHMVRHEYSGLLIDDPSSVREIATAMVRVLSDERFYKQLRSGAWQFSRASFSKAAFEERFARYFNEVSHGAALGHR